MNQFSQLTLTGKDSAKFLQGQLTVNVEKLNNHYLPCAISDLKGRVAFGLWVNRTDDETFTLITSADCVEALTAHLKKYGAFSKISQSAPTPIYPMINDGMPTFGNDGNLANFEAWAKLSIEQGNYWITHTTQGLFQPQELRLHQRGGVDYDKGCYLGQEIIARLWFRASPKAWLYRIVLPSEPNEKIQIVCHFDKEALVVARPDDLVGVEVLPMAEGLNESVARA